MNKENELPCQLDDSKNTYSDYLQRTLYKRVKQFFLSLIDSKVQTRFMIKSPRC